MQALIVEPHKEPYLKEIDSGLESLQREVSGYIEATYPYEEPVAIICNEEGKINGLPLNRALRDEAGEIYDILVGTFLVVGIGEEDLCSLPEDLAKKFHDKFRTPEQFIRLGGHIVALPIEPPRKNRSKTPTIPKSNRDPER